MPIFPSPPPFTPGMNNIIPSGFSNNLYGDGDVFLQYFMLSPTNPTPVRGVNIIYFTTDHSIHFPNDGAIHNAGKIKGNWNGGAEGSLYLMGANLTQGSIFFCPSGGDGNPNNPRGAFAVDYRGHIVAIWGHQGGADQRPTITNINANLSAAVVAGNDIRGTVTFNTGAAPPAVGTRLFTVNYNVAYGNIAFVGPTITLPVPVVTVKNQKASLFNNGDFIVDASANGSFDVYATAVLPASQVGLICGYFVNG